MSKERKNGNHRFPLFQGILPIEQKNIPIDIIAGVNWFVLDAAAITNIDFTGSETIQQVHEVLQKKGVTFLISNVADNVKMQLDHYGLTALIGENRFYDNLAEVLVAYQQTINQTTEEPAMEENINSPAPSSKEA